MRELEIYRKKSLVSGLYSLYSKIVEKCRKELIFQRLKVVSGDDFSIHICLIGCGGLNRAKKIFKKRRKQIFKKYILNAENASEEKLKALWDKYKKNVTTNSRNLCFC